VRPDVGPRIRERSETKSRKLSVEGLYAEPTPAASSAIDGVIGGDIRSNEVIWPLLHIIERIF
jgi:hypothetical protein